MTADPDTLILVATAERAIRNMAVPRYRTAAREDLLNARNALRARVAELEGRLTKGDEWCDTHAHEPSIVKGEDRYIQLLHEYEKCYDGLRLCEANL